nr:hypothetical protein [Psychromicrobium silvestre]
MFRSALSGDRRGRRSGSRDRFERGSGSAEGLANNQGQNNQNTYGPASYPATPAWRQQSQAAESPREREATRLIADHRAVNARWLEYELDVGKLIDYPMMSDVREPLTVEFIRAKRLADGMKPESPQELDDDARLAEYRQAVRNFEVSFDVAEREAKRIKDQHFSAPEQQRLKTARKLLPMAVDAASTQAERQLAYSRARKELDGLIALPDEALAALEKRVQAEISGPKADPLPGGSAAEKGK